MAGKVNELAMSNLLHFGLHSVTYAQIWGNKNILENLFSVFLFFCKSLFLNEIFFAFRLSILLRPA